MNVEKVESHYEEFRKRLNENSLDSAEYLCLVANLLFQFGVTALKRTEDFMNVNFNDAYAVELVLNQNPNNPYLAAVLQSHVILKWSEELDE